MTAVTTWFRRLRGIVNVGFAGYDSEMSAMNATIGYNLKNAVTLVAPYKVVYADVLFSRGYLDLPNAPEVETGTAAKGKFIFLRGGAVRSALGYNLLVPADFSGDHVQVYLSFESADGKLVSDSLYLGDHIVV
ncbi:DUF6266 family protein [Pedobacter heparinus]|uniref:DUF6266 family protein n=1 Tax=Pedobacter heparinus TaxID=984 RepID=UPI00292D0EA8|nr:DUF6266 family protein [Pedobacter heparinus]